MKSLRFPLLGLPACQKIASCLYGSTSSLHPGIDFSTWLLFLGQNITGCWTLIIYPILCTLGTLIIHKISVYYEFLNKSMVFIKIFCTPFILKLLFVMRHLLNYPLCHLKGCSEINLTKVFGHILALQSPT